MEELSEEQKCEKMEYLASLIYSEHYHYYRLLEVADDGDIHISGGTREELLAKMDAVEEIYTAITGKAIWH